MHSAHALSAMALAAFALFASAATQAPSTAQPPPASQAVTAQVHINGTGLKAITLDSKALAALPRTTLTVKERDDATSEYEGVRLSDALAAAGMTFGQTLRGPRLMDYLVAEAGDGYRVIFALPELDPEFSDRVVLLADQRDGKVIDGRDGPLRIVVSDERKHARWVRNLTRLTIVSAAPPQGAPAE